MTRRTHPAHRAHLGAPFLGTTVAATLAALFGAAALAAQPAPPVTVSPGHEDRFAHIRGTCPTFSWGLVHGASGYEIEVFRVDERTGEPLGAAVTSLQLHGSVTSWTPDAAGCLEAGAAYVWVARAEVDGQMSAWSAVRLLRFSAVPSAEEVAAARDVLTRFLAGEGAERSAPGSARAPLGTNGRRRSDPAVPRAAGANPKAFAGTLGGNAALRGQNTDLTGDENGLVGISSSPDGAGVVAAGAGIGIDLVLDGSTSGETDTLLWQGGIDRSSAEVETFTLENSGGGGLAVDVGGALTAVSFIGDGSALTGVSADDIECANCVGSTDLATNSVTGATVVNSSLRGEDIVDGTITGADIFTGSISAVDLASNSVFASEIAPNAVGSSEIASGAVGASEIATDAVGRSELKAIRVVSVECNGGCGDTASTLGLICGAGYSAIAVDCDQVENDDSSTTFACGGDNVCAQHFVDDNDRLGAFCFDQNGWDAQVYCLRD